MGIVLGAIRQSEYAVFPNVRGTIEDEVAATA